ncbi:MAG TPA: cytochrome c oxidase subunit II [Streptosporangiaceae bacterium]|nr:cytochrome c oxidase subunit II [Streptosporangiaceae bacterium]
MTTDRGSTRRAQGQQAQLAPQAQPAPSARPTATAKPATQPANKGRRTLLRVAVPAAGVLSLTGCTNNSFTRLGFPDPVTQQGKTVVTLWQGSWIAGLAVGAVVWGLILWAVLFHRKRGDRLPPQVRYNMPIEIMYTAVPFVLIAVFFYFTAKDENYIDKLPKSPAVEVNVTAFQWSWAFGYKIDGVDTGVHTTGNPWGYGTLPLLEIPVGETVQFDLSSPDVVHAFWVPEFLFKRDVIPDHPNHFTINTTKTGTFVGHCSELCGVYHSRMLFVLKIVTPDQFRAYVAASPAQQALDAQQATAQVSQSGSTQ